MTTVRYSFLKDNLGVSPVIAIILVIAMTIVLAAFVFVLVSELENEAGEPKPVVGLATTRESTSDEWNIRVTAAKDAAPLDEYNAILATPQGTNSTRMGDTNQIGIGNNCYQLTVTTNSDTLVAGERLRLQYSEEDCGSPDFGEPFGSGTYILEFIHRPTETIAGSISRTV